MTMLNMFLKGGPLMFVLLALSIALVGLALAKYQEILKVNKQSRALAGKLKECDNPEQMFAVAKIYEEDTPLSSVICKAQPLITGDVQILKDSMEANANLAVHQLEKGIGWISTIAAVAPLVGFLGTVTGMVKVFMNIQQHSQNGIDITYLAGGIWEALLTTIGGLIIGIVAIMVYNDLVAHVDNNVKLLQSEADSFVIKARNQQA